MAEGLKFDLDDQQAATITDQERRFAATLRKAGIYHTQLSQIGWIVENKQDGYEYVGGNYLDENSLNRLIGKGYEIVRTPMLQNKCACVEGDGRRKGAPDCLICKGTGVEARPDPNSENTRWRQEDGTHRRGDAILMRVKKEIREAIKGLAEINSIKAIMSGRERTVAAFQSADVPVSVEQEDSSSLGG